MPQVFVQSGSSEFSKDREANPYTIGWAPTYFSEGEAFGNYLAQLDEPLTVAILAQNDDFGADFVEGLNSGIEGSEVEIVAEASYEPTDTSVDAQVTELAGSNADVFFDATTLTRSPSGRSSRRRAWAGCHRSSCLRRRRRLD